MKRLIRFDRLLVAAVLAAAAAALPLAQLAYAGLQPPDVPTELEVPAGNKVFLLGHAVGVQIYTCKAIPEGFGWDFVAPRADLFDDHGNLVTTHFAGPTWQAKDGSFVKAALRGRVDVTGAIPWLRLAATSTTAGPDGDRLVGTTFIQRLATTGGLQPPPAECNAGTAGTTTEVPYTADYYFWKATGS